MSELSPIMHRKICIFLVAMLVNSNAVMIKQSINDSTGPLTEKLIKQQFWSCIKQNETKYETTLKCDDLWLLFYIFVNRMSDMDKTFHKNVGNFISHILYDHIAKFLEKHIKLLKC